MMINVFVDIEPCECIEGIREWKCPWNPFLAKYQKKMWCLNDHIKVDDGSRGFIIIWLDYLHACVVIWWIAYTREPAHESTGVFNAFMRERKQKLNTGNIETSHTFQKWVSIDKDCVVMAGPLPPRFYCMYTFTMHATNSWDVTRHIESGNGRSVECYLAIKCGEVQNTGIGKIVRMLLVVNKLLNEIREVRLDFSDVFRVNFVCCKCR